MDKVDAVVIGAGVVGLAAARALALSGRETVVLEAADAIGTGTSSRNSEVVHAGIYYPTGSAKARHCVAGKALLYAYCAERGIPAKRLGKLIVATDESQLDALAAIKAKAEANGVADLAWLSAEEARALEPNVACVRALLSPSSGIVDSHGLMLGYQGDLEEAGGAIAFETPVAGVRIEGGGFVVETGGPEPFALACASLVNAAGLDAPALARRMQGYPAERAPPAFLAKGNYAGLVGVKPPFTRPIYPIPEPGGLGIHATVDLGGQVRFGPDVEWVDRVDYGPNPARLPRFYDAIRAYWPGLPDGALIATYAGIRPKIAGPGEPNADFMIQGPAEHGVAGLVQLFGIESPGLTASLSIAQEVVTLIEGRAARAAA
jgi:L-2-hydroxyglutarate oxidase LhgO